MATRQYIGARYVPKFYENSSGTAEWRSGVIYEPLTIVTWNGNSYTSKKVVPATVGDPSSNSEYWVATGVFNEQVESLRQEVEEHAERIGRLEDVASGNMILIGDSYSTGIGVGGSLDRSDRGWVYWMEQKLGLTRNTNVFYCDTRTGGFHETGADHESGDANRGFLGQLYYLASSLTEAVRESISDIIVFGGWNDNSSEETLLQARAATFQSAAKASFPNARVTIGYIGGTSDGGWYGYINTTVASYKRMAAANGWRYIAQSELVARNGLLYGASGGLEFHPNDYEHITEFLINGLKSGCCDVYYTYQNATYVPGEGFTTSSTYKLSQSRGVISFEAMPQNWIVTYAAGFSGNLANGLVIGKLDSSLIKTSAHRRIPCMVSGREGGQWYSGPGCLSIGPNDEVMVRQYVSEGTAVFREFTSLTQMRILPLGELTFDAMQS